MFPNRQEGGLSAGSFLADRGRVPASDSFALFNVDARRTTYSLMEHQMTLAGGTVEDRGFRAEEANHSRPDGNSDMQRAGIIRNHQTTFAADLR